MKQPYSFIAPLCVAIAVLSGAGCTSRPEIRLDRNPTVSFSNYQTFAFANPAFETSDRHVTLVEGRMRASTRAELERRNYVYSERNPDLLVDLRIGETLNVDLIDAHQEVWVWQGVSTGRAVRRAKNQPSAAFDRAVSELFAGFPLNQQGGDLTSSAAAAAHEQTSFSETTRGVGQ